jgi:predicted transcriptional regulator
VSKRKTSFTLDADVIAFLIRLAEKRSQSKTEVLEDLIRHAYADEAERDDLRAEVRELRGRVEKLEGEG